MYHRRSIFNMLNNFGTNERFFQVCAREKLSSYRVTRIRMRIALESRSCKVNPLNLSLTVSIAGTYHGPLCNYQLSTVSD